VRGLAPPLRQPDWSIGDIAGWTPGGPFWLVWGSNGENLIRSEGKTRDVAWRDAEMQALALGILSRY
jgi:hypothetical protein